MFGTSRGWDYILYLIGFAICVMVKSSHSQVTDAESTHLSVEATELPSTTQWNQGITTSASNMANTDDSISVDRTSSEDTNQPVNSNGNFQSSDITNGLTETSQLHDTSQSSEAITTVQPPLTTGPSHEQTSMPGAPTSGSHTTPSGVSATAVHSEVQSTTLTQSSTHSSTQELRVEPEQETDHLTTNLMEQETATITTTSTTPSPPTTTTTLPPSITTSATTEASRVTTIAETITSTPTPQATSEDITISSTSPVITEVTTSSTSSAAATNIPPDEPRTLSTDEDSSQTSTDFSPSPSASQSQTGSSTTPLATPIRTTSPSPTITSRISHSSTSSMTQAQTTTQPRAEETTLEEIDSTMRRTPNQTTSTPTSSVGDMSEADTESSTFTADSLLTVQEAEGIYWTKNEVIVVISVMFVLNVFNLIVVVLCVLHIVNRRARWEPPPTRFGSRNRYNFARPQLERVRTIAGCDMATDADCKAEEKPLQTVSVITKDSGWCVPIEKQKKDDEQTEDTGL